MLNMVTSIAVTTQASTGMILVAQLATDFGRFVREELVGDF